MMSSDLTSPARWAAPSLAAALLFAVAGCATAPTPASGSISRPSTPPQPLPDGGQTADGGETPDGDLANGEDATVEDVFEGYTPPHMVGRDVKRAAVLLPFSHPSRRVQADAEGLLAAIELALFEHAGDEFLILPKDTAGSPARAEAAAAQALQEGADVVIGPLFAANAVAVASLLNEYESGRSALEAGNIDTRADEPVSDDPMAFLFAATPNVDATDEADDAIEPDLGPPPVLAFTIDRDAALAGAFLASIAPEEEVARVVAYAARRGVDSFAFLGPNTDYGRRMEAALRVEAARQGGFVLASGLYDQGNDAPVDEAKLVADAVSAEIRDRPGKVGILVPERGVKLRAVAPLLPYYGVDTRRVLMMGTSAWNDSTLWREPTLIGGIFPAPAPSDISRFNSAFERIYGQSPNGLASLGYDAAAMTMVLAGRDALNRDGVSDPDGFRGVNGIFRFRIDGSAERGLSVMEITENQGAVLAEPGRASFDPVGG